MLSLRKLKQINRKQQFQPGLFGLFINPNYFIKKGVYEGVRKYSTYLSGKVMDFGCGNKPFLNLISCKEYVGVDYPSEGHDHANDQVDVFYDGKKLPFADEAFDSIISTEVFEHIFNLEEMLMELNRVLKINGNILVTLPFVWIEHEQPNDFARYTSFGISSLMKKCGFEIIHHTKSTTYFQTLIQMVNGFVYHNLLKEYKFLRFLSIPAFTLPMNVFGVLLNPLFKDSGEFYLNHVIVAKKKVNI